jgi:mRNA-degrading endonuclease toxin of MazEF toxin-antitoxin module
MKDFDRWNELKKKLESDARDEIAYYEEGDIWWCSLGLNLGSEQDGKNELFERPVLVLRKFNERMAMILPLTSKIKESQYHIILDENSVILSQTRLVSVKRFQRFVRKISDVELITIKDQFIQVLSQP